MKEYIEKELLKERFLKWLPPDGDWDYQSMGLHPIENIAVSAIMEIEEAPVADVREVKHGYWVNAYPEIEPNPMFMYGICSECGAETSHQTKYCHECGSVMESNVEVTKQEKIDLFKKYSKIKEK